MVTAGLAAALTGLARNVALSALSPRWALAKLTPNDFSEVLLNHSKFVSSESCSSLQSHHKLTRSYSSVKKWCIWTVSPRGIWLIQAHRRGAVNRGVPQQGSARLLSVGGKQETICKTENLASRDPWKAGVIRRLSKNSSTDTQPSDASSLWIRLLKALFKNKTHGQPRKSVFKVFPSQV